MEKDTQVTDINYLENLKIIIATDYTFFPDNKGIKRLINIEKINMQNNPRIKNLNRMKRNKVPNISRNCSVNDQGIKDLTNIVKLNISNDIEITLD